MTVREKLQSILSAANAKTAAADTNVTDAVQRLIDGYSGLDYLTYATNLASLFAGAETLPETVRITAPNAASIEKMFEQSSEKDTGLRHIILDVPGNKKYSVTNFITRCKNIVDITFVNGLKCGNISGFFTLADCTAVYGELDLSEYTTANDYVWRGSGLTYMRFKPNSLTKALTNPYSEWDAATLVSLANSLVAGVHTLKLSASSKATIQSTHGKIDTSGAYAVFTASDDASDPTLEYFITQVKEWTLA